MSTLSDYLSEQNTEVLPDKIAFFRFVDEENVEDEKQNKFSKLLFGECPPIERQKSCAKHQFQIPVKITFENLSLEEDYAEAILYDSFYQDFINTFKIHLNFKENDSFFFQGKEFYVANPGKSPFKINVNRGKLTRIS